MGEVGQLVVILNQLSMDILGLLDGVAALPSVFPHPGLDAELAFDERLPGMPLFIHRVPDVQPVMDSAGGGKQILSLRTLRSRLSAPPADRTLRDDLLHLKRLGLVGSVGHGRGAVWFLKQGIENAANKAE